MPEADGEKQKGEGAEFDFDLAELQLTDRALSGLALRSVGIQGSLAGYKAYNYVHDNKVPDSNPWTGAPNSAV